MRLDYVMSAMFRGKYKHIQEELACHCSISAAVLPGIKKQMIHMWMKSLVDKVDTSYATYRKQLFQVAVCEKYLIGCHQTLL